MENKRGIIAGLVGLGLLIILAGAWSNTKKDDKSDQRMEVQNQVNQPQR